MYLYYYLMIMKYIFVISFILLINFHAHSDLIKPNPSIEPIDVIKIQLEALKNNNNPFIDAGISQTWEFAHPENRRYTGPLKNFTLLMKSPSYSLMLDHLNYNVIFVSKDLNISNYFVELTDKKGDKYGFTWTVKKVSQNGTLKNCWMTSGVSSPMPLAKSA